MKRRYIEYDTKISKKLVRGPSFPITVSLRELCVLDAIFFFIFTVQPQNVVRVHLRITKENYYNGKRCSKHPRDRTTIFRSIHLSRFHITKSPRIGRDEKERGIFLYPLRHSVPQEGRSHELYIRERANNRHD